MVGSSQTDPPGVTDPRTWESTHRMLDPIRPHPLVLLSHEAGHLEAGPSRRKRLVFQHEARRCPSTRVVKRGLASMSRRWSVSSATPIGPHPCATTARACSCPAERKSVEPMAAITAPARVAAQHQSLLHFVGQAPWSDAAVLTKVRDLVLPAIERAGPIEAWIIDDTGFPKKGRHSVGVARQYCGQLGKQDNCQVAVTLSLANRTASLPVAYRLYLPQEWADDPARRQKAGVPEEITFQTKP